MPVTPTLHPALNVDSPVNTAAKSVIRNHRSGATITAPEVKADLNHFTTLQAVRKATWDLNLKQRYMINRFIKRNAPTQPATTNTIKISFDYCKVDIRRPWLFKAFLNNHSWFIPGIKKDS